MSWSIEEHIGDCRPFPAQVVVYKGETDECLAYVSGEVADRLKAENEKLRELVIDMAAVICVYDQCATVDDCPPALPMFADKMRELGVEV